ncbi:MAG: hypothetical protein DRR08_21850 [Candidatus Parabeggiatoa sp. nov. 2]|nr:MAG: hypothetical protein B6247_28730 [Beggiatoa sp. 4572_84]RKZ56389.1 MAG: hypothetical protein DRR08_21850 [Gammaproteobacteria bacterium]
MNAIQLETLIDDIYAKPTLNELLAQAILNHERMTLTYQDKIFVALIPTEQVDLIEKIEDCIDIATIQERQDEDSTSLSDLKKALGL